MSIDRGQLIEVYGAYALSTVEAALPDTLTDTRAISILRDMGIPHGVGDSITIHLERMKPIAEKYRFLDSHQALPRDEIFLGYIADEALTLNGTRGTIGAIATCEGSQLFPVNSHLSTFVQCMALVEKVLTRYIPGSGERSDRHRLGFVTENLARVDSMINNPGNKWHAVLKMLFEDNHS